MAKCIFSTLLFNSFVNGVGMDARGRAELAPGSSAPGTNINFESSSKPGHELIISAKWSLIYIVN